MTAFEGCLSVVSFGFCLFVLAGRVKCHLIGFFVACFWAKKESRYSLVGGWRLVNGHIEGVKLNA